MATRTSTADPFTCVTCEIEIAGRPTFHVGLAFCCAGCVADGPCICSYDTESEDDGVRECLDVASVLEPAWASYGPVTEWAPEPAGSRRG
jgi:hypothetical protein